MSRSPFMGGGLPSQQEIKESFPYGEYNTDTPPIDPDHRLRLRDVGLDVMCVIFEDDSAHLFPYKIADTPQAYVAGVIHNFESEGLLAPGAFDLVLNDIYAERFDEQWSDFYPRIPRQIDQNNRGDL